MSSHTLYLGDVEIFFHHCKDRNTFSIDISANSGDCFVEADFGEMTSINAEYNARALEKVICGESTHENFYTTIYIGSSISAHHEGKTTLHLSAPNDVDAHLNLTQDQAYNLLSILQKITTTLKKGDQK